MSCILWRGYVPHIYVVDVEKSEEEARKLEEKKAAERKAKLEHAMGLDQPTETAMAAAFRKAKKGWEITLSFLYISMYLHYLPQNLDF